MRKVSLSLIFVVGSIASAMGQFTVTCTGSEWSDLSYPANESTSPHSFNAGTNDGSYIASAYMDRSAGRGGNNFSWTKVDDFIGKLTFELSLTGDIDSTSMPCVYRIWRTVSIGGYISGNPPPYTSPRWVFTQGSAWWDVTCPWEYEAHLDMFTAGYAHPDSEDRIELLEAEGAAHFVHVGGNNYEGTAEIWVEFQNDTRAMVGTVGVITLAQTTEVEYEIGIYSVLGETLTNWASPSARSLKEIGRGKIKRVPFPKAPTLFDKFVKLARA